MSIPEPLLHDIRALATYLGLDEDTARMVGADAFSQLAAALEKGLASREQYEHVRWFCIETLLWEAALREKWSRIEASRQGKRVVSASVGIGWGKGRPVSKTVEVRWRNRLLDLFEHPAVRDAMQAELYDIILGIMNAQVAYDREISELKKLPNAERLRELQGSMKESNRLLRWQSS